MDCQIFVHLDISYKNYEFIVTGVPFLCVVFDLCASQDNVAEMAAALHCVRVQRSASCSGLEPRGVIKS